MSKKKRKLVKPKPEVIPQTHRVVFRLFTDEQLSKFPEALPGDEVECLDCGADHILESVTGLKRQKKPDAMFLIFRCRRRWQIGALFGKLVVGRIPDKEVVE